MNLKYIVLKKIQKLINKVIKKYNITTKIETKTQKSAFIWFIKTL